jgi:HK97 family phage major capsid protein
MSEALLTKYMEERQSLSEVIDNTLGRADAEQRDLVPAEIETLEGAKTRIVEIDGQVEVIRDTVERRNAAIDLTSILHKGKREQEQRAAVTVVNEPAPSLGEAFVNSEQFRNWAGSGPSDRMSLGAAIGELRAVLSTSTTPIGKDFLPAPQKIMAPQGVAEFPLLGSVSRIPVNSNSADIVVYGAPKGATGATKVDEGKAKPEAALTASSVNVPIPTWAYWVEVTRQLLQDAPAVRAFIDQQLRTGLVATVEKDISDTITAGTYTKTTGAAGVEVMAVARQAIATVQAAGFRPNAILTDPQTAAGFDISLMGATLLGAAYGTTPWGLQVVPVAGLTKTYVGDFRSGIALLERTGVEVFITDSGITGSGSTAQDRFTSNIMAILAEARSKAVVVNPAAVTELVITPKA